MLERRLQSRYAVSVIMRGKKQPASTMRYVLGPSSLAIFDTERRSWRPSCTARVQKEYLSQLPVFSGVPCLWISVTLTFSFLVFAVTIQYYAGPNTAQYPTRLRTRSFSMCTGTIPGVWRGHSTAHDSREAQPPHWSLLCVAGWHGAAGHAADVRLCFVRFLSVSPCASLHCAVLACIPMFIQIPPRLPFLRAILTAGACVHETVTLGLNRLVTAAAPCPRCVL